MRYIEDKKGEIGGEENIDEVERKGLKEEDKKVEELMEKMRIKIKEIEEEMFDEKEK